MSSSAHFEEARLVTLTGPGGIGKTSLGTELARAQAARFGDGAWFVALDLIGDADLGDGSSPAMRCGCVPCGGARTV